VIAGNYLQAKEPCRYGMAFLRFTGGFFAINMALAL
jgi:hypothetical protein